MFVGNTVVNMPPNNNQVAIFLDFILFIIFSSLFLIITLSNSNNIAGKIVITTKTLIRAPLDISVHIEPIISISEYNPTPKVAAKKHIPLINIDGTA